MPVWPAGIETSKPSSRKEAEGSVIVCAGNQPGWPVTARVPPEAGGTSNESLALHDEVQSAPTRGRSVARPSSAPPGALSVAATVPPSGSAPST